jgi:hypothetical protein
MVARALAFFLLAAAALTDSSGAHAGAFYFLLAAVPAIAVGGLSALGELADIRGLEGKILGGVQAVLSFLALALAIVIAGSRSGPLFDVSVPGLSVSALGTIFGVFVFQAGLGLVPRTLRVPRRPRGLYVRAGEDFATAEHVGL